MHLFNENYLHLEVIKFNIENSYYLQMVSHVKKTHVYSCPTS